MMKNKIINPITNKYIENLEGFKCNKLTAMTMDTERMKALRERGKRVEPYWLCKCDCGNPYYVSVKASHLKSYNKKDCCCKKSSLFLSIGLKPTDSLVGIKFNKLTVIEQINSESYKCRCDCGNIRTAKYNVLIEGNMKSCGCLKIESNIKKNFENRKRCIGEKYGKLTIKEVFGKGKDNRFYCICDCDCGTKDVEVYYYSMKKGVALSCGCIMSKGEYLISEYLINNNIEFNKQVKYKDLKGVGGLYLSYDFYIPKANMLIEFQGTYHDGKANWQSDEEFEIQKEHDRRKRNYAKEHDIRLLEIWYYDMSRIDEILKSELID